MWRPIIFCANLQLKWGLKQSDISRQDLFNNMWHATCKHVIQGDYWILVVGNQIDTLTSDLSFGHNLFCKYSNGSWYPILDIYILKYFQWYKEILNPMNFEPSNCSLKIWDSVRIPNSQSGSPLGSVWAHSITLFHTPGSVNVTAKLHSWLAPFHALAFQYPFLGYEPKVRVVIVSLNPSIHSIELHSM